MDLDLNGDIDSDKSLDSPMYCKIPIYGFDWSWDFWDIAPWWKFKFSISSHIEYCFSILFEVVC